MFAIARAMILAAAFLCAVAPAHSQELKQGTGSISGRVTVGEQPLPGVAVALRLFEARGMPMPLPTAKARTDEEGRYRFTDLAAGQYMVSAFTPTLASPDNKPSSWAGRGVTLADGEEVEGIDFPMREGGVITGRVTDAEGRPLINERVSLLQVDEQNRKQSFSLPNYYMFQTDDRGVYRLYGIPPGKYLISVGFDTSRGNIRVGFGGDFYTRTFHPDATDESFARTIEVTSGGEATGIDISVGRPSKTFRATGRAVYADSGKPVSEATCGYGPLSGDGKRVQGYGLGYRTDSEGNLVMEGLLPGRYAAFCNPAGEREHYSAPTVFEVKDEDLNGLEIRVHRGGSISGFAMIEGTDDPDILARLPRLQLSVSTENTELVAPQSNLVRVQPDGSFHIGGLHPGKARIIFPSFYPANKGFHLVRVEREGTDQPGGIEIKAGETVSNLRVALVYGNGRIRGQIKIEGGAFPENARFRVIYHRTDMSDPQSILAIEADERGRFLIEGLMAGEYEISLLPIPGSFRPKTQPVKQNVTVTGDGEAQITIVIDLNAKDRDGN